MNRINTGDMTKEELLHLVEFNSEELFRSGTFFCSEAIVQTINEILALPYDENVVKLASGFPIGMGKAGCLCGAISGGQMALGMVYGRIKGESMNEKMFDKSKALHDYVKNKYKSTCCRVITHEWQGEAFMSIERKTHCITITGKVARWVANVLIDDGQILVKS